MLEIKSYEELMNEALTLLPRNTPITNLAPGSIARALVEVMNRQLANFYDSLSVANTVGFLSTSTGDYLDLIGQMLDCQRLLDESDNNYRYRISKQVTSAAAANKTAVRLAILAIDGVKNVRFERWVLGTGSFAAYVTGEEPRVSDELLQRVQDAIDETQAYGNRGLAIRPEEVPIEMRIRLTYDKSAPQDSRRALALEARRQVREYIQNLDVGAEIIINEIIQRVMNVSENIKNLEIYHFYLHDEPVLIQDHKLNWDEKVVESDRPNAILVA